MATKERWTSRENNFRLRKPFEEAAGTRAYLADPESVKGVIAKQDCWSVGTKYQAVQAYKKFARIYNITWNIPRYKPIRKKPWIPLESEIDMLIASCGRKMAALLQLLKETGMRRGEALMLEWTDVDFERCCVTVNHPEKHGLSRQLPISNKLLAMLNNLPKAKDRLFGHVDSVRKSLTYTRKKAAAKLQNPRLNRITFHTFRHFYATMEYARTKDILHVKERLGHRCIDNTLIYTQLINFKSDEWRAKRARTREGEDALIEAGFEYVRYDSAHQEAIYRKRK